MSELTSFVELSRSSKTHAACLVGGALLLGITLRFWGLSFGLPEARHPDSHYLTIAVQMVCTGDLNPHDFKNPPLLTYLFAVSLSIHDLVSSIFGSLSSHRDVCVQYWTDPTAHITAARGLVAAMGAATALLVGWTTWRLFGFMAGWFAGLLAACSFLLVRDAHYAVNDIPSVFLMMLSFHFASRFFLEGKERHLYSAAALVGLATATKYHVGLAVIPLTTAVLLRNGPQARVRLLTVSSVVGGAAFLLFCPWPLLDPMLFADGFLRQARLGGAAWLGQATTSSFRQLSSTLLWGFGALPLLLSLLGIREVARDRRKAFLVLGFPVAYYLFISALELFFVRFAIPLIPYLCIAAGVGFQRYISPRLTLLPAVVRPLIAVGISFQGILFSVAHNQIVSRKDTRSEAASSLHALLPPGASIAADPYSPQLGARRSDGSLLFRVRHLSPHRDLAFYRDKGVDYIIIAGYYNDRYLKQPGRFAKRLAVYDDLKHNYPLVYRTPGAEDRSTLRLDDIYSPFWNIFEVERHGPVIEVYRITSATERVIAKPLDKQRQEESGP